MSATEIRFVLYALGLPFLFAQAAVAQTSAPVSEADMARARQAQPTITDQDVLRIREKYRVLPEEVLRSVAPPSMPNLDALPQPRNTKPQDLEAIAKGFGATPPNFARDPSSGEGPALMVFVSFAIPQASLQRLVDQAARAQATLVLRGLVEGSLQKTALRVHALIGRRHVAFQIDPQAFDRFSISKTPSFVLVRAQAPTQSCAAGRCLPDDAYVVAAGDVSLDYALVHFQDAAPAFSGAAGAFLARLRSTP